MKLAVAWASRWARVAPPVDEQSVGVIHVDGRHGDSADEMVIRDPARIRRLVGELTHTQRLLSLQTPDGLVARSKILQIDASGSLDLRLIDPDPGMDVGAAPALVNVTASGQAGLLLFTLGPLACHAPGYMSCDWPQQLIQMQSRRHFRAKLQGSSRHRATLELPGVPSALRLQDLSEEGVGFLLEGADVPDGSRYAGARLILDREVITVPWVQVLHCRPLADEPRCAVGAQLMDLTAEDTRRLRRWMASAQAQLLRPVPLAQV